MQRCFGGMGHLETVQTFSYRLPRFKLQLPCDFFAEHGEVEGQTSDMSDDGLGVLFRHPVLAGTQGRLRLKLDSCWFEADAEVVHAEFCSAGLRFRFASEAERRFLQSILRLAARSQERLRRPVKAYAGL